LLKRALVQVFEPSIIKERLMTDEDEAIRQVDAPERMQMLSIRYLGKGTPYGFTQPLLAPDELHNAAEWIAPQIDQKITDLYLTKDASGYYTSKYRDAFMNAIYHILEEMHTKFREAPFIWMHRRDYLMYLDPNQGGTSVYFLERPHLWRIQALSYDYRSLLDRKAALLRIWDRLGQPNDPYFADYFQHVQTLEEATDLSDWINTRFYRELRDLRQMDGDNPAAEEAGAPQKLKRPKRTTPYERAKDSHVAALASVHLDACEFLIKI
jgi:transcription elongation factor SPT6